MAEKQKVYIVIRRNIFQSVARTTFTVAMLMAMIGVGVYIDSSAMQWIGGILCILVLAGTAAKNEMTAEEAIEFIRSGKPSRH